MIPIFSGGCGLNGRKVFTPIDRYCRVHDTDSGKIEHIFCYEKEIPTSEDEPRLYDCANVSEEEGAIVLSYDGVDEEIWLMTIEADDLYRLEHPDIVAKNEVFRIDK